MVARRAAIWLLLAVLLLSTVAPLRAEEDYEEEATDGGDASSEEKWATSVGWLRWGHVSLLRTPLDLVRWHARIMLVC